MQFQTAVRPIPQFDPNNPVMISQGPSMCIFNKEDPQEVLASWLFAQYMLTNSVQIAYSQTEGYLPVTTKAQEAEEYQSYLAAAGSDNDLHYDVKIKASRLLQDNIANTFVTPVFNGSTSLRNAAGQMIEEVTKSTRRKQTVDAAYMEKLESDMVSLYRLDQIGGETGKAQLGKLPPASVALLCTLGITWVLIGVYAFFQGRKQKKNNNNH